MQPRHSDMSVSDEELAMLNEDSATWGQREVKDPLTSREVKKSSKYPWSVWTDGKWHSVQQGADFECTAGDLQVRVHNWARRKNLFVLTHRVGGDRLRFRFFKTELEREEARWEEKNFGAAS